MSPVLASRFFTTEPSGKCPLDRLARVRSDCGGLSERPEPVWTGGACFNGQSLFGLWGPVWTTRACSDCGGLSERPEPVRTVGACLNDQSPFGLWGPVWTTRARLDCGGLSERPEPVRTVGACLKQAGLEGDCRCYRCSPGLVDVRGHLLKMADFQTSSYDVFPKQGENIPK